MFSGAHLPQVRGARHYPHPGPDHSRKRGSWQLQSRRGIRLNGVTATQCTRATGIERLAAAPAGPQAPSGTRRSWNGIVGLTNASLLIPQLPWNRLQPHTTRSILRGEVTSVEELPGRSVRQEATVDTTVPDTAPLLIAPETWLIPHLHAAGGALLSVNSMVIRGAEPVII